MFDFTPLIPGDNAIATTANKVRELVYFAVRLEPRVRSRAESLVAHLTERDGMADVGAVQDWVMKHYRYTKDPIGVEFVKTPAQMLSEIEANDVFLGDCDDVSCLVAALLMSIGYKVNLVVMSLADPAKGSDFKHIYLKVWLPREQKWLAVECTARGRDFGWEAPSGRTREFPL